MTRMLSWVLMPTKPMSSGRFKRLNTEFCSKLSLLCANICRFSVFFHFWTIEWRWRQSISLPAIYLQSHSVFEEKLLIIMECVWLAAKDVLELKCEQWYWFWRVLFTMPPSGIQHVMISGAADRCCDGQSLVCKYKAIDNLWEVVVLVWDWRWLQEEETKNKRGWRLRVLGFSSCVVWIVLGCFSSLEGPEWSWFEMRCAKLLSISISLDSHTLCMISEAHFICHFMCVWHQLSRHWLMQCNWLNVKEPQFYGLWNIFNILLRGSRIGDQCSLYIELWCVFYPWSAIWTLQNVNKL
jgi:hypothetical protein